MISPQYVDGLELRIRELTNRLEAAESELRSHKAALDGIQTERDALAAHVGRLKRLWEVILVTGGIDSTVLDLKGALAETPETSLARLIAEKQAEAAEQEKRDNSSLAHWAGWKTRALKAEAEAERTATEITKLRDRGAWLEREREALIKQKNALAAHVERLIEWADTYVGTTGLYEEVENARNADTTSLARRDMLMKAEALESAIDYGFGHKEMAEVAAKLRRQAKEKDHEPDKE